MMIKRIAQVIFILILLSCDDKTLLAPACVKGMYTNSYCTGYIITILDDNNLGKDLYLSNHGKIKNGVIAHIDTSLAKTSAEILKLLLKGSPFYFTYVNGSYPQKAFINCNYQASIIITSISSKPCYH